MGAPIFLGQGDVAPGLRRIFSKINLAIMQVGRMPSAGAHGAGGVSNRQSLELL